MIDVLLPFVWWQRVLIVLALLLFSPALVVLARLGLAVVRLLAGTIAIGVRRTWRRKGLAPELVVVPSSLRETLERYADDVRSGRVIPPDEYGERVARLRRRGLSASLARTLYETRRASLLRSVEALTDAQLAEISEIGKGAAGR